MCYPRVILRLPLSGRRFFYDLFNRPNRQPKQAENPLHNPVEIVEPPKTEPPPPEKPSIKSPVPDDWTDLDPSNLGNTPMGSPVLVNYREDSPL